MRHLQFAPNTAFAGVIRCKREVEPSEFIQEGTHIAGAAAQAVDRVPDVANAE